MDVRDSGVSSIPCDRHNWFNGLKPICRYPWKNQDNDCHLPRDRTGRFRRQDRPRANLESHNGPFPGRHKTCGEWGECRDRRIPWHAQPRNHDLPAPKIG